MGSYGQFCPVAKAVELLGERWTLLIVRELGSGSRQADELARGIPRISPAQLAERLDQLVRAGVATRHGAEYLLTEAGRELRPVVEALGAWGVRWTGKLDDDDLDPRVLLWDMHRNIDRDALPPGRTVLRLVFSDVPAGTRQWWLVVTPEGADVCDADPGHEVAVTVSGTLRGLVEVWRGDTTWADALRIGTVVLDGPEAACRAVPTWFTLSLYAAVPRR